MTREKVPYADGLDEGAQRRFLDWALAAEFTLPSAFGLGCDPHYELAAYQFYESIEDEAMEYWIEKYPGSRPPGWWAWRSPEPLRLRLGGSGVAEWVDYTGKVIPNTGRHPFQPFSILAITRRLPEMKAVTDELPRYQGCWRGLPIGGWDGGRGVKTIDPDKPPVFEAEATFLRRHGLLTPQEAQRLDEDDFEPVALILKYRPNGALFRAETEPV